MTQRLVKGKISRPDIGWNDARIVFTLMSGSFNPTTQYPGSRAIVRANALGEFAVSLWANEEGELPSRYSCDIPGEEYPFEFTIPAGTGELQLSALRESGSVQFGSPQWTSILALVEERIAAIPPDTSEGISWTVVTQSMQLLANRAYVVDSMSLLLLQLPTTAVTGDRLIVYAKSGIFRITQSDSQQCQVGNKATTQGLAGSILSTEQSDLIELVFLAPTWSSVSVSGNFNVL